MPGTAVPVPVVRRDGEEPAIHVTPDLSYHY